MSSFFGFLITASPLLCTLLTYLARYRVVRRVILVLFPAHTETRRISALPDDPLG